MTDPYQELLKDKRFKGKKKVSLPSLIESIMMALFVGWIFGILTAITLFEEA